MDKFTFLGFILSEAICKIPKFKEEIIVKTIGIVRKEIYLDSLFEYIYFLNCIINQKRLNIFRNKIFRFKSFKFFNFLYS